MSDLIIDYSMADLQGYLGHDYDKQKENCKAAGIIRLYGRQIKNGMSQPKWGYTTEDMKRYLEYVGYIEIETEGGIKLVKKQNIKDKFYE